MQIVNIKTPGLDNEGPKAARRLSEVRISHEVLPPDNVNEQPITQDDIERINNSTYLDAPIHDVNLNSNDKSRDNSEKKHKPK